MPSAIVPRPFPQTGLDGCSCAHKHNFGDNFDGPYSHLPAQPLAEFLGVSSVLFFQSGSEVPFSYVSILLSVSNIASFLSYRCCFCAVTLFFIDKREPPHSFSLAFSFFFRSLLRTVNLEFALPLQASLAQSVTLKVGPLPGLVSGARIRFLFFV